MGISLFRVSSNVWDTNTVSRSNSGYGPPAVSSLETIKKMADPNPDPEVFEIIEEFDYENASVFFVNYKNCTNYEGNKVLVFSKGSKEVLKDIIRDGSVLDPHFLEGSALIARFAPTDDGLLYARELADKL